MHFNDRESIIALTPLWKGERLPDGRLVQRLSPRRSKSHWTQLNIDRCASLEARGLMTEAGRVKLRGENGNRKG